MSHWQILTSKPTWLLLLCESDSGKNQNTQLYFEAPGLPLPTLKPAPPGRGPAFPPARGALPLSPQASPPPPPPTAAASTVPAPPRRAASWPWAPAPPQPPRATGGAPQTRVLGGRTPARPSRPGRCRDSRVGADTPRGPDSKPPLLPALGPDAAPAAGLRGSRPLLSGGAQSRLSHSGRLRPAPAGPGRRPRPCPAKQVSDWLLFPSLTLGPPPALPSSVGRGTAPALVRARAGTLPGTSVPRRRRPQQLATVATVVQPGPLAKLRGPRCACGPAPPGRTRTLHDFAATGDPKGTSLKETLGVVSCRRAQSARGHRFCGGAQGAHVPGDCSAVLIWNVVASNAPNTGGLKSQSREAFDTPRARGRPHARWWHMQKHYACNTLPLRYVQGAAPTAGSTQFH